MQCSGCNSESDQRQYPILLRVHLQFAPEGNPQDKELNNHNRAWVMNLPDYLYSGTS